MRFLVFDFGVYAMSGIDVGHPGGISLMPHPIVVSAYAMSGTDTQSLVISAYTISVLGFSLRNVRYCHIVAWPGL
eukprot:3753071-Rhodomonas_salina.3